MRNLFSYDSKLTNVLTYIGDLFILNVIYLICCIPIFTIGPAQAGLYTATRLMLNPEDDNSVIKAFFKGFANGFGKISLVGTFFLLLDIVLLYTMWMAWDFADTGMYIHWAFPAVFLILCLLVHSLLPAFHSQFSCTPIQLFRNCILLLITHPLRSLGVAALTWAPAALFFLKPNLFLDLGALFITVYFSVALLFGVCLLQKPFKLLIDDIAQEDDV